MNRRKFLTNLGALGLFSILPGAGRVWKAERKVVVHTIKYPDDAWTRRFQSPHFSFLPSFQDFRKAYKTINEDGSPVWTEIFEPRTWPPNMGETTRIINDQSRPLANLLSRS